MNESFFRSAMKEDGLQPTAIDTRVTRARKAEELLRHDFDVIVASDDLTYYSLITLKEQDNPEHAPLQNTLRKYYYYRNGREFPRLASYRRRRHK